MLYVVLFLAVVLLVLVHRSHGHAVESVSAQRYGCFEVAPVAQENALVGAGVYFTPAVVVEHVEHAVLNTLPTKCKGYRKDGNRCARMVVGSEFCCFNHADTYHAHLSLNMTGASL